MPAPGPAAPPATPVAQPSATTAARTGRARWFALGAVLGAVATLVARGEARATLVDLRQWSARELRRLEHKPQSAVPSAPVVMVAFARPVSSAGEASDCCGTSTPAPGTACAELLAPFLHPAPQPVAASEVPWVRAEDLPRASAPTVARRHHRRPPVAPAPSADAPAEADEEATTPRVPGGEPPPAPTLEPPSRPARRTLEQTAENDARW
jgi:hypothetical protein